MNCDEIFPSPFQNCLIVDFHGNSVTRVHSLPQEIEQKKSKTENTNKWLSEILKVFRVKVFK